MNEVNEKLIKASYVLSLKNGCTRQDSAIACGVSDVTIWNWKNKDEEFSKAIDTALESRIQVVEDALFKSATTGINGKTMVIAQIFWLKNRGKNWKDKSDVEFIVPKVVKQNTFIQAGEEPKIIEEEIEEIEEVNSEINLDDKTKNNR